MKIIKLTSATDGKDIYINTDYISFFFEYERKENYPPNKKSVRTVIHAIGHNNGGFDVMQSPRQIMNLIKYVEGEELG